MNVFGIKPEVTTAVIGMIERMTLALEGIHTELRDINESTRD